jgi:O-antigen/teichoic acid export membrane protein
VASTPLIDQPAGDGTQASRDGLQQSVPPDVRGARSVFSDYAAVLGARFVSVLLSLCSVLMSTRILQPAGYGVVAYFTVIATLVFTITSAWTSTAVARYGREQLDRHGSMANVSWARFAITTPLIAVATVVVPVLKLVGALPPELTWSFTALAVGFGVLWILSEHVTYMLEAAGRMKLSAVGLIVQQAAVVGSLAVIYITGKGESPIVIACISVISMLVVTGVLAATLWKVAFWPPVLDRPLVRRIFRFSVPMIAFTASQYLIRSADLVVIRAYTTPISVGIYAVAYQAYTILQTLAAAAPPVLTPLFVSLHEGQHDGVIRRYFERVVPQLTFIGALLAGLSLPLISILVPVVFGDSFSDADVPLSILMLALVLFFTSNLYAPIIVLYERTRAVGVLNAVAAAINIGGDILLVGPLHLGIAGAAIATTAALAVISGGYVVVARTCIGEARWPNPLVLLPVVAGLAVTLAASGAYATAGAFAVVVAAAVAVQVLVRPFDAGDAELIQALDIPGPAKRALIRVLLRAGARR